VTVTLAFVRPVPGPDEADRPTVPLPVVLAPIPRAVDPPRLWTQPVPVIQVRRPPPQPKAPRSAPRALRITVGVLVAVLAGASGVLVYGHTHRSWYVPATNVAGAHVAGVRNSPFRPGLHAASISTTADVYELSARSFAIGLVVPARCWTVITSTGHPSGPVVAQTLGASRLPQWFDVSGRTTVVVAARVDMLLVRAGSRLLGQVPAPVLGRRYVFQPVPPPARGAG